ncbi:MAG: hypothetical protein AAFW64_09770, partial [Pseudomonadota bacterium]
LRSGEHPGFSRMVIDLGQLPRWSLESNGNSRRLTFDGPSVTVDVSRVFDRIGRKRISSVASGTNEIQFELACACSVTVFGMPGGRLVVDVRDGPARPRVLLAGRSPETDVGFAQPEVLNEGIGTPLSRAPSVVEPIEPLVQIQASISEFAIPSWPGHRTNRDRPDPPISNRPDDLPRASVPLPDLPHTLASLNRPQLTSNDFLSPFGEEQRISEATAALVDALERASELGLVDRIGDTEPLRPGDAERQSPPPGAPLPLPIGDRSSLRITTSLDRDLARLATALGDRAAQSGCLSEYDLDVGTWGDLDAPMVGFSQARTGLFGEFDEPDIDAARALVRVYLFLAFGAEAKSVLDSFPFEDAEKSVLSFLAEVADGKTRTADDEAAALLGCQGSVAIWALLSIPEVPAGSDVAKSEIAATFSALPLHLRKRYGPTLVQRFLGMNDAGTARLIWNAVDRADTKPGEEFILASAELASANGETVLAERAYAQLEAGSPENAPKAVVRLIRSRLERDASIDPGLIETAAALSFENRGTPVARDLKFEEIRGRTALNQWDRVFQELPRAEFAGALSRSDAETLLADHFTAIAERADTNTFLRRAFQANDRLPIGSMMDRPRRAIANRLTALGFHEEALILLDEIDGRVDEDTLTAARADISAGDFQSAIQRLNGVTGTYAARLRGTAFERLGQFEAAVRSYQDAEELELAEEVRQRAGDWNRGSGEVSRAAAQVLAEEEIAAETPLARNRALVGSAETLRNEIATMRLAAAGLLGPTE